MKKILFLLLFVFVGFLEVSALETSSQFKSIFIGYYHYVDEQGKFGDFEIFKRISDEKIAYCIEPGVPLSDGVYLGFGELSNNELANKVGLSSKDLNDISLYSYYGYGYQNHKETAWIVATQVRIWEILGRKIQFTSRNSEANPFQYVIDTPSEIKNMMAELDSLVSKHKEKPSFDSEKFSVPLGDTHTIQDSSLEGYHLVNPTNEVILKDNKISITPKNNTEVEIFLEKENAYWSSTFLVYAHPIGQNLILTGNVPKDQIHFYYEGIAGSFEMQKFDEETKSCNPSLENAIYGIYSDTGILVTKLTISNCRASYHNLALGNYYIQEIKAPTGYELDTKKYPFSITKESISKKVSLTVFDKRKKIALQIHKDYVEDVNVFLPEENATFDVLSSFNKVVATIKTDKNGNASVTLPYGTYTVIQKSGKYNYKLSDPQTITIDDSSSDTVSLTFLNEPILKKVKVIKLEKNTNQKIKMAGIPFKIFDIKRNKYVCETENCIYKTDQNGEFTTGDLFPSTYLLEEVKTKIPNLLWNSKKVPFILDETSKDIVEISFFNEVVQGSIDIIKKNESGEPLEHIVFHLFSKEDIFDIHGKLVYSKDELVDELTTDSFGHAAITNIPLGNYYLKEVKTQPDYLLDETNYDISLSYQDEETSIVNITFELINYPVPKTKKDFSIFPFLPIFLGGVLLYEKKNLLFPTNLY